jgi:hypothetical protein
MMMMMMMQLGSGTNDGSYAGRRSDGGGVLHSAAAAVNFGVSAHSLNSTCAVCLCSVLLQVTACPADAAQGLLSSGGTALLTSALQASAADAGPSAAQLQHQLLSAVNAVLSADQGPSRPPGDLTQLMGALHALLESPDACVAAAAKVAVDQISRLICLAC